jgi:hypothetical protein
MQLLEELISFGVQLKGVLPLVKCKVFKDNLGTIELANSTRMRPCTKHINIQYHHFQAAVQQKKISIQHVSTKEQVADITTKPLPPCAFFQYLRRQLVVGGNSLVCEGVLGSLKVVFPGPAGSRELYLDSGVANLKCEHSQGEREAPRKGS